jgi:hypothetical protein
LRVACCVKWWKHANVVAGVVLCDMSLKLTKPRTKHWIWSVKMSDSWKTRRNQKTSLFSYEFDRLRKSCTKCLFCALYVLHLSYFIFRLYTIHIKNIIKCPFLKNMSLSLIFCRKAHVGCFRCLLCARHSFGPKLLTSSDIIFFLLCDAHSGSWVGSFLGICWWI